MNSGFEPTNPVSGNQFTKPNDVNFEPAVKPANPDIGTFGSSFEPDSPGASSTGGESGSSNPGLVETTNSEVFDQVAIKPAAPVVTVFKPTNSDNRPPSLDFQPPNSIFKPANQPVFKPTNQILNPINASFKPANPESGSTSAESGASNPVPVESTNSQVFDPITAVPVAPVIPVFKPTNSGSAVNTDIEEAMPGLEGQSSPEQPKNPAFTSGLVPPSAVVPDLTTLLLPPVDAVPAQGQGLVNPVDQGDDLVIELNLPDHGIFLPSVPNPEHVSNFPTDSGNQVRMGSI